MPGPREPGPCICQEGLWDATVPLPELDKGPLVSGPRDPPAIRQIGWTMHRYRSHTCGELRASDVGTDVRLSRLAAQSAQSGRHPLRRSARPLRHRPARRPPGHPRVRGAGPAVQGVGGPGRRHGRRPQRRTTSTPSCPPARSRSRSASVEVLGTADPLPFPVFPEDNVNEERAADLPLPRPAPPAHAPQHHAALRRHQRHPAEDDRAGLQRDGHPDPVGHLPRGRPRLPGALPPAPGQVLRAAAGAAAVQAAADDRRLRPLLPDRAVLPRRGHPRRPLARRVLPARRRDELRRAGGRLPASSRR